MLRTLAVFLGWVLALSVSAAEPSSPSESEPGPWELKKEADGIAVYTRAVPGSRYRAVRATMTVEGTLEALVALTTDLDSCSEWAAHCKKSLILRAHSDQHATVYTLNDLPWPVADRVGVTDMRWQVDPESGTVSMVAKILGDDATDVELPKARGAVRLQEGRTSWSFEPRDDGRIDVVSEAHIDPEGATPAWLTNRLLVGAPFDTLESMRTLLASGRYDGKNVSWLPDS